MKHNSSCNTAQNVVQATNKNFIGGFCKNYILRLLCSILLLVFVQANSWGQLVSWYGDSSTVHSTMPISYISPSITASVVPNFQLWNPNNDIGDWSFLTWNYRNPTVTINVKSNANYLMNLNNGMIGIGMFNEGGPAYIVLNVSTNGGASNFLDTIITTGSPSGSINYYRLPSSGYNNLSSITFTVVPSTVDALGSIHFAHAKAGFTNIILYGAPIISSFNPASACPQSTVTISGSNFTGATSVTFGGVPASFTVLNDSTINAVVGSANGAISVTAPAGTATSSSNFTNAGSFSAYAYVANLGSNTVSVINTATNVVTATIGVGYEPSGVAVSPDGSKVYVTNDSTSSSVSVINTATNSVTATIPVGFYPEGVCVSPDGSKVYIANKLSGTVSVISSTSNTVTTTINVGTNPSGIVISPDGTQVFVTNAGSNTVSVISTSTNTVTATVNVGNNPIGICISPDGTKEYVTNYNDNTISIIYNSNDSVLTASSYGTSPQGICMSPDGTKVYVANSSSNEVSVISSADNSLIYPISNVGDLPIGISISPDGTLLYVADYNSANVSVISTSSNAIATINVGSNPYSVGNFIANVPTGCSLPTTISSFSPIIGCAGTIDTITGANITGATSVSFGGVPATSITVLNDSTITAVVGNGGGVVSAKTIGGIAVSSKSFTNYGLTGYAYITNLQSNFVSVINTSTNTVSASVNVGVGQQGVCVSPDGSKVYVTANNQSVYVISTATNTVTGTITVGSNPWGLGVSPDGSTVYVPNYFSNTVSVINTASNTVTATIGVGSYPFSLCISPDGKKVYVSNTNDNTISIISTANNSVIATIGVGTNPLGGCTSPDGTKVYVANGDGTVSVINTSTNAVTSFTAGGGQGICISPDGSKLYIAGSGNNVSVVNTATNTITATIPVGVTPKGISVSSDGAQVYVTNYGTDSHRHFTGTPGTTVSVINTATNTVTATVTVGNYPIALGNNFIANIPTGCNLPSITSFSPTSATSGNTVTILGNRFTSATNVSFGGVAASSFTVVDDNTITAVVGNGASGNVSVTLPSTYVLNSPGFTYSTPPNITSISPLSGTPGTLVAISGSNLFDTTAITIGGVGAIVVSTNNTNTNLMALVMPGATTGNISLANGSYSTTYPTSFNITSTPYPSSQQGNKLVGTGGSVDGLQGQGYSVAISADGNTAIVGGSTNSLGIGAAWVYTRSGGNWSQQGNVLKPTDYSQTSPGFGSSVSISADGSTVIIGGPNDSSGVGSAWIFTNNSGIWSEQARLIGTGGVGLTSQGISVSISADGNTAIVGGYNDNSAIGAAWVYSRTNSVWTQVSTKLVSSDNTGSAQFGYSVALSADGKTALIGGSNDNSGQGAAWIFRNSNSSWTQQGNKLTDGTNPNSSQGSSVALCADGNTAIVGGPSYNDEQGASWIYSYNSTSGWSQQGGLLIGTGGTGIGQQGYSVSLSADGNTALVGGFFDNNGTGAAWTFTRNGSTWLQQGHKLVGNGLSGSAYLGNSVALSLDGTTSLLGGDNDSSGVGAAWVFVSAPVPNIISFTPDSTLFGAIVTVKGANFSGTNSVSFGGVQASSFNVVDDNTISAIVASGASGYVSVTNSYGVDSVAGFTFLTCLPKYSITYDTICANSLPFTWNGVVCDTAGTYTASLKSKSGCDSTAQLVLTVNSLPVANITGTTTGCSSVALVASGGNSYSWSGGNTPLNSSNTFTTSGNYTVSVKGSNGCATTINRIVIVNPLPIPQIAGSTKGCDSIKLVANGGVKYSWTNGVTILSDTNSVKITQSGTYTVTVTDGNGCSASATSVDTVNANPVASITGTTSGCDSVTLTASGAGSGSYSWSGGNTTASDKNTFNTSGTYSVTITDANGCDATASQSVVIYSLPILSISGKDTACNNVTLTASGGVSYLWSGGNTPTVATNTFTNTGRYEVTVKNANNCSIKGSVYVTVNQPPSLMIQQSSNGCGNIALTANVTPGGNIQYDWGGLGSYPTSQTNDFISSDTYTVNVTDSNGCSATASQSIVIGATHTITLKNTAATTCVGTAVLVVNGVNSANKLLIVKDTTTNYIVAGQTYQKDTLLVVHVDTTLNGVFTPTSFTPTSAGKYYAIAYFSDGCDAISLTDTVNFAHISITGITIGCQKVTLTAIGGDTYTWNAGTSLTSATNTFTSLGNQTVIVTGTDSNFCIGTDTASINVLNLTPPVASITSNTSNNTGCDSIILTASGGSIYSWNGGSTPLSASNKFMQSGVDTVTVTAANGCSVTVTDTVIILTPPTAYIPGFNSTCGLVTLTAAGGVSYLWSEGKNLNSVTDSFTVAGANQPVSVIVFDSKGCSSIVYDTITVNAIPTITISGATANCDSVKITASGGIGYNWNGGLYESSSTNTFLTSGTYTVQATNANGCSDSLSVSVTVNPQTPSVNISATDSITCTGTSVTFTATPNTGGTSPSYQWLKGGVAINGATTAFYSYIPVNGDAISCVLTLNSTCLTTPTATSNTIVMKVNTIAIPSVSIAITNGSQTICSGTSVTFTATPTNVINPSYDFRVNGTSVQNGSSYTYTNSSLANGDNVDCIMSADNNCQISSTLYSNTISMNVTSYSIPSVSIAASINNICSGTSVTITATPTNGGSSPTYNFKVNGTSVQNGNSAIYTSSSFNNGDVVSCIMTANNTCQTMATATSGTVTINVSVNVTPSVSIAASTNNICSGTSVIITATPTNGGSSPTYDFKVNGTSVQNGSSATYTSSSFSNGDVVSCIMTANNTCQTMATATSGTVTINVSVNVTPSVSIAASTNNICSGTNVIITATPTNGGSSPTYNFKVNGTSVQNGSSATYTSSSFSNDDVVSCIITANNTCQTMTTATSGTVTINVSVNVTPSVSIAASTNNICSGTSVTITATPTNGGSSPTYNFKVNGTSVQTGSSATYTSSSFSNGDVVSCIMTANNTCQTTSTATSGSVTINVTSNLTPSVSITTPSTTITSGTSVTFTATPTNGGTPTYQWKKNGSNIIGETGSTYTTITLVNNDVIEVVMTSNAFCATTNTATSNPITMTVTSVVPNYTWTGATSTDWGNANNWSNGVLPTSSSSVIIPSSPSNQPVISASTTVVGISVNGVLSLNGHVLTINGAITGSGYLAGTTASSLVIGGNAGTVRFNPSNNSLKDLTINGTTSLGNALNLYGTLTSTSGTLTTGGNLTLKSIATGTAVVAPVLGSISGIVNIERYIPQGYAAYRDLGVCVSGAGTIANTWGNSLNNYSAYTYNNGWSSAIANTTSLLPFAGYRVLVTGYKNPVPPSASVTNMNSDVTLTYSGSLLTGNQTISLSSGIDKFSFISNPYASQVDVTAVTFSGIYNGYWYLDPTTLYGTYEDYNYFGVNVGASNIYGKNATQYLQPGQAFFVCSNSASPSITFTESAKSNGTSQASIFGASNKLNRIATGLFANGKNLDGAVTVFNSSFSDGLGKEDGLKINNHGENLTFTLAGKDLCANGMSSPKATDELPLHLFQLNPNTAYSLRLDVSQFVGNGLIAYLKDNLSNTSTQLAGDSNIISFKTNTDTSIYSNRFSIVFNPSALPVKTISLTASQLQGTQVSVKWSVVGQSNIASYKVERSTNGTNFTDLTSISPAATNNYSYIDATANEGINYYRIKATDNTGTISYSKVASCQLSIANYQLSIAPNPVTNGSFNLTIGNTGKYTVVLLDKLGQTVYKTTINHTVATALENVTLGKKLAAGSYIVTVRGEDGKVLSKEIIIN